METQTSDLTQRITDIATPLAASLGLAIWGVDVVPSGRCVIRVFAESLEEYNQGRSILVPQGLAGDVRPSGTFGEESRQGSHEEPQEAPDTVVDEAAGEAQGTSLSPVTLAEGNEDTDAQGGITIDQCAELSRLLGLSLEVEDCVESAYVLEVSSPGLERLFFKPEQLQRAVGAKVEVTLVKPLPDFPGRRKFIGCVAGVEGDMCTLTVAEPENAQVSVPWGLVKKIKQIYVAPEKNLPGKSVKNTRQKKSAGKKKK